MSGLNFKGLLFGRLLVGLSWLFLNLFCLWGCINTSSSNNMTSSQITFLDVGQGLAVLMESDGRYALYDTGPDSVGLWDSLKFRGIDTLDWVIVSHNHRDHGGGFLEVPKSGAVFIGKLYVGPDTSGGFVRDSILRVAKRLNISVDTLYRGDKLALGSLEFKVLWPTAYLKIGGNEASAVLQVGFSTSEASSLVLLTGDLDSVGENHLMNISLDIESELLQVGHHGSAGSSSLKFLTQVAPAYGAISVGHNNYGHPSSSVLQKLTVVLGDSGKIYRTDLQGSVEFTLLSNGGVVH